MVNRFVIGMLASLFNGTDANKPSARRFLFQEILMPAPGMAYAMDNETTLPPSSQWCGESNHTPYYGNDSVVDAYCLLKYYGPRQDPLVVVLPVIVTYFVIFITGLIGNISTCMVIAQNKAMHTATNYYLFSLAISDLLLLVSGLPQEVYAIWSKYPYIFGEAFCIMRGLAAETSANATVLTITAFTVERYVAICHPFLSHTMSKLSRAVKLILAIWCLSLLLASVQALQFGIVEHFSQTMCLQKTVIIDYSFEISTFVFFFTPMTVITVLYALIGYRLRRSNMMTRESKERGVGVGKRHQARPLGGYTCRHNTGKSSRRVLKMLVAVVVAFFICWAPFHVQRLVAIYGQSEHHQQLYAIMTYISGVLYYTSTTVNPVLYHIMSHKFREAFKEALGRWRWCRMDARPGSFYSPLAARRQPPVHCTDYSGNSVREEVLPYGRGGSVSSARIVPSRPPHCRLLATRALPRTVTLPCDELPSSNWDIFKILSKNGKNRGINKSVDTEQTTSVDSVTQTAQQTTNRNSSIKCLTTNISNSSLRKVEARDLADELSAYMEELQLRERG